MRTGVKRIGIMGGTFDPVHLGHIRMGEEALRQLGLEEVWYIPSGVPAYKLARHEVSSAEERLQMLRLALEGRESFRISEMEILREGNTYTSDTLTELHRKYPEVHFYFLVGGDSLDYMDRWHEAATIFRLATIGAFPRLRFSRKEISEKAGALRDRFGARIRLLTMEPFDYSSTDIRTRVREGAELSDLLPDSVARYISENRLYSEEHE